MILKYRKILSLLTPFKLTNATFHISQLQQKLTKQQHIAYLSSVAINRIRNLDMSGKPLQANTMYVQKSLTDQILYDLENSKKQYELNSDAYQLVSSYFKSGIKIDSQIFSQICFQQGMTINDKNGQKLFRFHPTRIVTGQLFNKFFNDISVNIQRCYLYTGYSGISKSVAVMLLTLLSNNIAQYNYNTYGLPKQVRYGTKNGNLLNIIQQAPKILYESMTKNIQPKNIQNRLLKQCQNQIGQNEKKLFLDLGCLVPSKYRLSLTKRFKQRNILCILICDQINILIGKSNDMKNSFISTGYQTLDERSRIMFTMCFDYLKEQIKYVFYISPILIQWSVLKELRLGKQGQNAYQRSVEYLQRLPQLKTMFEIADIFLFEIQIDLKNNLDTQIPLNKQLKEQLNQFIQQAQIKMTVKQILRYILVNILNQQSNGYSLSFYFIRSAIRQLIHKYKQQQLQQMDPNQLIDKIKILFKKTLKLSQKNMNKKLNSFFNQRFNSQIITKYQKYRLIFSLYYGAVTSNSLNNTQNLYQINIQPFVKEDQFYRLSKLINCDLFFLEFQKMYSYVPPLILINYLESQLLIAGLYILLNKKLQYIGFIKSLNSQAFGAFAQNCFILMCINLQMKIILNFDSKKFKQIIFENIDTTKRCFKQIPKFNLKLSIKQKRQKNFLFLNSFRQHFTFDLLRKRNKAIIKKGNEKLLKTLSMILVPSSKKDILQQFQQPSQQIKKYKYQDIKVNNNSLAFDFIVLKFDEVRNIITINVINITKSLIQADAKLKANVQVSNAFADRQLCKVINKNGQEIELQMNIFVICPQQRATKLANFLNDQREQMSKYLEFQEDGYNLVHVKNKQNNNPLILKRVGYLRINKQARVQSTSDEDEQNKNINYILWRSIEKIYKKD